jgi:hypothetical protein
VHLHGAQCDVAHGQPVDQVALSAVSSTPTGVIQTCRADVDATVSRMRCIFLRVSDELTTVASRAGGNEAESLVPIITNTHVGFSERTHPSLPNTSAEVSPARARFTNVTLSQRARRCSYHDAPSAVSESPNATTGPSPTGSGRPALCVSLTQVCRVLCKRSAASEYACVERSIKRARFSTFRNLSPGERNLTPRRLNQ